MRTPMLTSAMAPGRTPRAGGSIPVFILVQRPRPPSAGDIGKVPQHGRHLLLAHLLRPRDAVGLCLSVGVTGTKSDKNAALPAEQHELALATRVAAADFDAVGRGQPPCGDAI